ncbi:MAG: DUF1080 domain-containing protein, partial [Rhodospirillales bacterium]|nr:DUF1080 domain-containing protein [Rhodospirillales bacterium]
ASVSHPAERAWVHISDDAPLTVEQISEALGDLPFESAPMTEEATDENEQPVKEDQPQALFMAPANTSTNSSVMTHPHEEDGFAPLFDGKTLDAFTIEGGKAKYKVADGVIVGHSVPNTPNTFLTTKKVYGDFILEYEFKNDPALNSGVQVRSHAYDESKTYDIDGKERKIAAGRMHGYQIEIDTNPDRNRMWSAGVFEEGRRGWLYPGKMGGDGEKFTEQGRKLTKVAEWNTVRVEARGNTIKTYLNGELRTDMTDTWNGYDKTGHIAFQVHGVGKREEPMYVSWRNLRIKELK